MQKFTAKNVFLNLEDFIKSTEYKAFFKMYEHVGVKKMQSYKTGTLKFIAVWILENNDIYMLYDAEGVKMFRQLTIHSMISSTGIQFVKVYDDYVAEVVDDEFYRYNSGAKDHAAKKDYFIYTH